MLSAHTLPAYFALDNTSNKLEVRSLKSSIENTKNSSGRIESGTINAAGRKLKFTNSWDDAGHLAAITFDGKKQDLPTPTELMQIMDEKFIERIRLIDLIDQITLIETIATINKIAVIESITSLPNITVLGSEGCAFEQTAPVAGAYFSPTGHEASTWIDPDDAFDGFLATSAEHNAAAGEWTPFLVLTFAAAICDKTRIYAYAPVSLQPHLVDVDVYQGSAWIHVYEGLFTNNVWTEKTFSQGSTSKVRVRFHNGELADPVHYYLYEVEMWRSPTDGILEVQVQGGTLTQSTKHDAKVYQFTAAGSAADGATVINNVANKVIKIHRMFLQSTVDAATNVYLYEETSGNLVTVNTTLNAREGRETAFVPAPACIGQTTTVNKKVLLKNAATKQVYWEIVYSADDAS